MAEVTQRSQHSQECKNLRQGKFSIQWQADAGKWHGKPVVASIACWAGITAGKNPAYLTYAAVAAILHSVWRPTQTLWPWPLTLWPQINGFPRLTVKLLFVKFGDHSCVGFWDIVWKNRQTAVKALPMRRSSACVMNTVDCTPVYISQCCSASTLLAWMAPGMYL